jgi:SpoVK/Ycf46/Vps4 family AAA+-type ATPase
LKWAKRVQQAFKNGLKQTIASLQTLREAINQLPAWVCRRWLFNAECGQESQEQPVVTEISAIKNGVACTKLSDVAGMEEVKTELHEKIIEPFIHPELFERFHLSNSGSGALLYGPPGNGKTFVARAVAGELDAKFFPLNPADIKRAL